MLRVASGICLLWGAGATYCFFYAWMGFLGLLACVVGLIRRELPPLVFARLFGEQLALTAVHGLGLVLVFAFCWQQLHLGRRTPEIIAFLIAAMPITVLLLTTIPGHIDRIWRATNPSDSEHPD